MYRFLLITFAFFYHVTIVYAAHSDLHKKAVYFGVCDGSAGVALADNLFADASDEDNWLRIYSRLQPGEPVQTINMSPFLGLQGEDETDIEGAAKIEDIVYLITSHGADKHGVPSTSRQFLFALKTNVGDSHVECSLLGEPYRTLVRDLAEVPSIPEFDFRAAAKLSPKKKGALNIEGLAAFNGQLYIGFRNPIIDGKALVVPLKNPKALLTRQLDGTGKPEWGNAIQLDLNGRGIRDIQYDNSTQTFWIIAGCIDGERDFALYEWKGPGHVAKNAKVDFGKWNPEAIVVWPDRPGMLQILSDDGTRILDETSDDRPCKELSSEHQQFRSGWLRIHD